MKKLYEKLLKKQREQIAVLAQKVRDAVKA